MATSHTPGPRTWTRATAKDNTGGRDAATLHERRIIAEVYEHVGYESDSTFDVRPVEANARLISAAPALLACLKMACWHLENQDIPITDGSLDNIRAAIAKATGGNS